MITIGLQGWGLEHHDIWDAAGGSLSLLSSSSHDPKSADGLAHLAFQWLDRVADLT
jgi:hypothetical protein